MHITTKILTTMAAIAMLCPMPASGTTVTGIENTTVYVAVSLPPTPVSDLVKYSPTDAEGAEFDLSLISGSTPEKYIIENGTIEVLAGASDAIFRVSLHGNSKIKGMLAFSVNPYPTTAVSLEGVEGDDITLDCHDILAMRARVEPGNSANKNVVFSISDTSDNEMVATYSVGGSEKFTELVTYRPGTFRLTLSALENPEIKHVYNVTVNTPDATDDTEDFNDGTFWINEDWFTHKNGSLNYLKKPLPTDESDIIYRVYGRNNDDAAFGATSQYGMIFANKLFVMSKQSNDSGDMRRNGGGRLVVADAHTLRRLASFDDLGGDGRACVGVNSHKAYIGTHAGIRVLTWNDNDFQLSPENIKGINNNTQGGGDDIGSDQSLYNKQIGDMVISGNHVFALQQETGVHVIDTATDTAVRLIADSGVQGIAVTADGHIWYASSLNASANHTMLHEIDPVSMSELKAVEVPGSIGCSWGSWRSTNFFASKAEENMLFWNGGFSSITTSGSTIYKWNTTDNPDELEPIFTLAKTEGIHPGVYQQIYASMRYDERINCILLATTTAPSGNYRYNWLKFIDANSGEIVSDIRMKDYYWFPALPVFPDKHAPVFEKIPAITFDENANYSRHISFKGIATDSDNIDSAINISYESSAELEKIVEITPDDDGITIRPLNYGTADLVLRAESNGRDAIAYVPVSVSVISGITTATGQTSTITLSDGALHLTGLDGETFFIHDMAGNTMSAFTATGQNCTVRPMLAPGVYILTDSTGKRTFKFTI